MEKLVVLSDDESPQEFPLVDKRCLVGRDSTCDICLADRSVSRHHATLRRVFHGFSIEDEGSTNGTRVNSNEVTKRFLKHGDLIEIGKYKLRYIAQVSHHEADDDDPDRTVVLKPVARSQVATSPVKSKPRVKPAFPTNPFTSKRADSSPVEPVSRPSQRPAWQAPEQVKVRDATKNGAAKVRFLEGEHKGEERVIDRSFFSIGNPGGDLVLINQRHNGYYLLKVGGNNVPQLNGKPIRAGGVQLESGDRILLGELSLEFQDQV
jgi:pSer/pThr/pTyr-binding forkhead associated (FHA) protein